MNHNVANKNSNGDLKDLSKNKNKNEIIHEKEAKNNPESKNQVSLPFISVSKEVSKAQKDETLKKLNEKFQAKNKDAIKRVSQTSSKRKLSISKVSKVSGPESILHHFNFKPDSQM